MVRQSLLQSDELLFQDALTVEQMRDAFDAEGISFGEPVSVPTGAAPARNPPTDDDGIIDTPGITLWAMRSQALFTNVQRSCRAAVQRVAVSCELRKHTVSSTNMGAYSRARSKVMADVVRRLAEGVVFRCEAAIPDAWRALATGPYAGQETGETALFRTLFEQLQRGDLVLSDRYYGGGFLLALLRERGVEFTTRRHQYRAADFRRGKRPGKGDHIVAWAKPQKPGRFDQETYDRLLRQLAVRELEVRVNVPGFRTASLVVVTSRVDHQVWAPDDLAGLYLSQPKLRDWRAACRQAADSGPSQETRGLTARGSHRTSHLGPCKVYLVAAG